jgi:outer membrane protein assembly factor BamD
MISKRKLVLCVLGLVIAACAKPFIPARITPSTALYEASLREYQAGKWENAILGFEKLTLDLPARDTLLSRSHWYLGMAHFRNKQFILAGQSLQRLTEAFPDDSLADDALFEAGRAYSRLWRKPVLDPQYGQLSLSTFRTLLALYPNTDRAAAANAEIARLEQMFATKDYEVGMHYLRRRAYDSAIIYFQDVVANYPNTPRARDAYLRLAEAFGAIRYREDAREVCGTLRTKYPGDADVMEACGPAPAAAAAPTP